MKIMSPAFEDSDMIPATYTCDSDNVNPPLDISDVPEGTRSLALIMDDPDAPGEAFTHWIMWNIPPHISKIEENEWVDGAEQGMNDGGDLGYTGPCPPEGVHHYHFKLYALSAVLDLRGEITREMLEREINENLIEEAELIGLYKLQS
jgi:Raf kinase inhibitor-like YbhB/YbcL family protein